MNPQFLIVFTPFLAVLYVLFALIQALRGKRQGTFAALLAFIAAAASMAAFVVSDELVRARIGQLMLLNAIIAFVASLLILLIERRRQGRDPSRSYGILGVGLSILLALGTYVTPLLANAVPASAVSTAAFNRPDNSFQTISALTPGAIVNGAQPTEEAGQNSLATILSAQTGLAAGDLTTQINAGSSIAQLVSAHNGDLSAVTTAVKGSLDELVASGGRGGQLLTRFGSDTTTLADQIVQGQLPAQIQTRVIDLLTGTQSEQGAFQPQANATPQATTVAAPIAPPSSSTDSTNTVADVLNAQTGLNADDLMTQVSAGSTIADLVSAHNGDLSAVTEAIKGALDDMIEAGGREAGMISRLGSDTGALADQIVQGQLAAQQQQFIVSFLITGALPQFGGQGNGGGFAPPSGDTTGNGGNFVPPSDTTSGNAPSTPAEQSASVPVDPPQPTATPVPATPAPTTAVERPTRIAFPTLAPTTEASEAVEATSETSSEATTTTTGTTCTLITNYNLNLRDKPGMDGSIVLLSIPMGTSVTASARTSDGWYSVSYDGHNGWVTSEYASVGANCDKLPTQ